MQRVKCTVNAFLKMHCKCTSVCECISNQMHKMHIKCITNELTAECKVLECTRNETKWCFMQTNASKMRRAKPTRIQGKTNTHRNESPCNPARWYPLQVWKAGRYWYRSSIRSGRIGWLGRGVYSPAVKVGFRTGIYLVPVPGTSPLSCTSYNPSV